MFFFLLMVAGNDSTRAVFTSGIKNLLEDPEQMRLVRSGEVPLEQVVEEFVRYNPAFAYMRRTATRDTELAGKQVRQGDKLALWYVSGNRDEASFDDPDRFDVRREPNPHQGFGGGGTPLLPRRRPRTARAEALDRGNAARFPRLGARRRHRARQLDLPQPVQLHPGRPRGGLSGPGGAAADAALDLHSRAGSGPVGVGSVDRPSEALDQPCRLASSLELAGVGTLIEHDDALSVVVLANHDDSRHVVFPFDCAPAEREPGSEPPWAPNRRRRSSAPVRAAACLGLL